MCVVFSCRATGRQDRQRIPARFCLITGQTGRTASSSNLWIIFGTADLIMSEISLCGVKCLSFLFVAFSMHFVCDLKCVFFFFIIMLNFLIDRSAELIEKTGDLSLSHLVTEIIKHLNDTFFVCSSSYTSDVSLNMFQENRSICICHNMKLM